MTIGEVTLNILDGGGVIAAPLNEVQVVIGCATAGPVAQVVATRSVKTLQDTFTSGPLVEAAALTVVKGGTVLAIRATTNTAGSSEAVQFTGTGSSVITVTGTPVDAFLVQFVCTVAGTIGSAGIKFKLSLDAGRNFGPELALGTANTFVISGTGLTLNFAAGTLAKGDIAQFGTIAPAWNTAGILACINALAASQYATAGWGSFHIVGDMGASDAATIEGYLDNLASASAVYTRAIADARDAHLPTAWGGAGETETAWVSSLESAFAAASLVRMVVGAGHYNTPTAIPNPQCGAPSYRRPGSWSVAAKRVTIPPQRHDGRVRDGSLNNIVINPDTDPADGFVYHDEFLNPGLTSARFMSFRTRRGRPGFFVDQPNLMSTLGSVFTLLPIGNVMDVACKIVHDSAEEEINDDIPLNPNGTITDPAARAIEAVVKGNIKVDMIDTAEIVDATVVVDRSVNVRATSNVVITVTIFGRGYVLSETVNIGFASPFAAGG